MCQRPAPTTFPPIVTMSVPSLKRESTKKAVQFGDATVVGNVTSYTQYTEKQAKKVWYQPADYKFFKETARVVISKESVRSRLGELDEFYPLAACLTDTCKQRQQERLNRWCRHTPIGRGIERRIHPDYGRQSQFELEQHRNMVLRVQQNLEGQANKDEGIRAVSEACSYNARAFSVMMGAADEYAIKKDASSPTLLLSVAKRDVSPSIISPSRKKGAFGFKLTFGGRTRNVLASSSA
jgi:hypothetical protein